MDVASANSLGDEGLYDFLKNATKYFREGERIKKYQMKNGDCIHCILWNYHFYITGTDIVKILIWRFQNSGKPIGNIKKFEEGIFSDLRNLKPGIDATLENPRSDFLEFLYKNGCIRTQKKQKVFYWYSVPHDALFCDALERDPRRDTSVYGFGNSQAKEYQNFNYGTNPSLPFKQKIVNKTFIPAGKVEAPKRDLFNIKSTLFGNTDNVQFTPHDLFNNDFKKPAKNVQTRISDEFSSSFGFFNPNNINYDDFEDESKLTLIKSKVGNDLKRKFDDFDFDQLGFVKNKKTDFNYGCEKLNLNDKTSEKSTSNVRFVGMPDLSNNE